MHKCTDHAEGKGYAMTQKQDQYHYQYACPHGQTCGHIQSQRVEHTAKHTAGKTEGKQTDVAQQLIDIITPTQKTVDALQRLEMPAGVYIDIKMKTK